MSTNRLTHSRRREELIRKFVENASPYTDGGIRILEGIVCPACGGRDFEKKGGYALVCLSCFAQQPVYCSDFSFSDHTRTVFSCRPAYNRQTNFEYFLGRYQGRQNYNVPQRV